MELQLLVPREAASHLITPRAGQDGTVKPRRIREPIEGNKRSPRFEGFPYGFLTELGEQQVGTNMTQAVLIGIEPNLEKNVANLLVLAHWLQDRQRFQIQVEELLAEGILEACFFSLREPDD